MKKIVLLCLSLILCVTFSACGKEAEQTQQQAAVPATAVFETSMGTFKCRLDTKNAPLTTKNFIDLSKKGFYNGLTFHRVIDGFMIQGGDPYTRDASLADKYGQGGPDYTIPAEFIPEYTHKKGALAAARRGDAANPMKESSGSQFYLVQDEAACSSLNGDYTVYGETIEGLDVIDKIAKVETNNRDLPINPVQIIEIKLDPVSRPVAPTTPAE